MKSDNNILKMFEGVETEKAHKGYMHSVSKAAVIVVLGLLCGLKNINQIHQWACDERVSSFLRGLGITKIPCYYWLTRLVALMKPESVNQCFYKWVRSSLPNGVNNLTVAIDGKSIRSTMKEESSKSPLHIVSAHIGELKMTLAQKAVEDKSNEIPAVQELIKELKLDGCIVVADAMHCQKETARLIVEGKADYLLNAKNNQKLLCEEIKDYVQDEHLRQKMDKEQTTEKNRNRLERRTAYSTTDIGWMACKKDWAKLKCIGAICLESTRADVTTEEWHYYISSRKLSAKELLRIARLEWSVETMHWLLDVNYGEDFCRLASERSQKTLNILRKTALNLLRSYKEQTGSKKAFTGIMFDCLMNPQHMLPILNLKP